MIRYLKLTLLPLSAVYSTVVYLRNRLFDLGILKSEKGKLPTIVVGNLSAGGTGKTPHVEFLIKTLQQNYKPAILSRGYGRKTRGFILANHLSKFSEIGDEPLQIKTRFPELPLAVCEDRLEGITRLKAITDAGLVVLDDAFQHRKLRGDINILLMDYHHPWWGDFTLPAGMLRDNVLEMRRADIIIVSKCPENINSEMMAYTISRIKPQSQQSLYFTRLVYGTPVQISGKPMPPEQITDVLGFSGIAQPMHFQLQLAKKFNLRKFVSYPDHHIFSHLDILYLLKECGNFAPDGFVMITTEKDAVKLKEMDNTYSVPIFFVPVEIEFVADGQAFQNEILEKLKFITI